MKEPLTFVGLILVFTALPHACAPTPIIVDPPITDPCVIGCKNVHNVCGDDADNCSAACLDAVNRNLASWIRGYVGPRCWAAATTPAKMEACPGRGPGTCGTSDAASAADATKD
jgi:hypothetical protein